MRRKEDEEEEEGGRGRGSKRIMKMEKGMMRKQKEQRVRSPMCFI